MNDSVYIVCSPSGSKLWHEESNEEISEDGWTRDGSDRSSGALRWGFVHCLNPGSHTCWRQWSFFGTFFCHVTSNMSKQTHLCFPSDHQWHQPTSLQIGSESDCSCNVHQWKCHGSDTIWDPTESYVSSTCCRKIYLNYSKMLSHVTFLLIVVLFLQCFTMFYHERCTFHSEKRVDKYPNSNINR